MLSFTKKYPKLNMFHTYSFIPFLKSSYPLLSLYNCKGEEKGFSCCSNLAQQVKYCLLPEGWLLKLSCEVEVDALGSFLEL